MEEGWGKMEDVTSTSILYSLKNKVPFIRDKKLGSPHNVVSRPKLSSFCFILIISLWFSVALWLELITIGLNDLILGCKVTNKISKKLLFRRKRLCKDVEERAEGVWWKKEEGRGKREDVFDGRRKREEGRSFQVPNLLFYFSILSFLLRLTFYILWPRF